ncbi:MAG: hypothetical protein ACI8UR_002480 [Natronomonas sp.]|jgi:hypothetical protein|uniref:hypothetical protein n=1 Tax=Natronomonas sp. TaxID=2184060 RepID=UPI00398A3496
MKPVTELIDTLHDVGDGTQLTVETEGDTYRGVVHASHYEPPESDATGRLRVGLELDDCGDLPSDRAEVCTASETVTEKFSRPLLRVLSSDDDGDVAAAQPSDEGALGEVVDLRIGRAE